MDTTKIENIEYLNIENKNNISKDDNLIDIIFDFSLGIEKCVEALNLYYEIKGEETIELISRLTGMYQFSGSKILEKMLIEICNKSKLSTFLKYESSKSLIYFEEITEHISEKEQEKMKEIKISSNKMIENRNLLRKKEGYKCLDNVCKNLRELATPCKLEAVYLLMEYNYYKLESIIYFKNIINDQEIDCDYRYKSILSLEKKDKINKNDRDFFLKESMFCFLFNNNNMTMYRILSGQYILQNIFLEKESEITVEKKILEFATDENLDYNLRADASDTLLNLSINDDIKNEARNVIITLGNIFGKARNIFENAQNVHTEDIEKSVADVLEYLSKLPILEINKKPIDFEYINNYIEKNLKDTQDKTIKNNNNFTVKESQDHIKCKYCGFNFKKNESKFCSKVCLFLFDKEEKIKISLNRINVDRILYSKFNQTLVNILLKIWTYIQNNEYKETMYNRLLEELYDMAGTCSSGFASRLINTISGFGEFNIHISWDDQIVANFSGRLNALIHKITDENSIYHLDKHLEIVELYLRHINIIQKRSDAKELRDNNTLKSIIEDYLSTDKKEKIKIAVQNFYESVISEMIIPSSNYHERPNFIKFFRDNMLHIRQELYEEFKQYITDTEFDLAIRRAISQYEGFEFFL